MNQSRIMKPAGYSGTPLAKKPGIKPGFVVRLVDQPEYYFYLFTDMPEDVHFEIFPAGSLWISWPKKAAKIDTDVTEDHIREIALNNGLEDVKVCAVDQIWSGLKLVVPVNSRL